MPASRPRWPSTRYHEYDDYDDEIGLDQLNGHSEVPVPLLPQRNPGASGIARLPVDAGRGAGADRARARAAGTNRWPEDVRQAPVDTRRSSRPRAGAERCARAAARRRARAGAAESRRRNLVDGGCRRRDLPEDAVRVAGRSDRAGQQQRSELGVGLGSRLVGGGGRGGRAGRHAHRARAAGARPRRPAGARSGGSRRPSTARWPLPTGERTEATTPTTR